MRLGIMQGRLSPPVDGALQAFPLWSWREEFPIAQRLGLAHVEWVYDGREENPFCTWGGICKMEECSREYRIRVNSLCADYFVANPLIRATGMELALRVRHLKWLLCQCQNAGISKIVLPFVDNSAIRDDPEIWQVAEVIREVFPASQSHGVIICLETNLNPRNTDTLLYAIGRDGVGINYDSGNSASLGYNSDVEWAVYGERIRHVHLKDRERGGKSVPWSRGAVNIPQLFANVNKYGYAGEFTLQLARGKDGREESWIAEMAELVLRNYSESAVPEISGSLESA